MDRQNLQPRSRKQPPGKALDLRGEQPKKKEEEIKYIRDDKIEVEIREIVRIKPQDFAALKNSFEEWASQWE